MSKEHRPPIDTKAAAVYTGMKPGYLEKLRCIGGGPTFIKRGGSVRYSPDALDAWLNEGKYDSTSQTPVVETVPQVAKAPSKETITVQFDAELVEQISSAAGRDGFTKSEYIRRAVISALESERLKGSLERFTSSLPTSPRAFDC